MAATLLACGHSAERTKKSAMEKGQRLFQSGDYGNAALEFRRALKEDTSFGDAYYWLGRTENLRRHYPEALANLSRAAQLLPRQDAPKVELADILLTGYLGSSSRPPELYRQIEEIAQELGARDPSSFYYNRLRGYLAEIDARHGDAAHYFETANRARPNQPDVITAMAQSLTLDGRIADAERAARDFLRVQPTYGPLYDFLYQQYMREGRLPDAEEILKSKAAHNPGQSLSYLELARYYLQTGRRREMAEIVDRVAGSPKEFPRGHLDAGDFYSEQKQWADARGQYEQGAQSGAAFRAECMKRLVRLDLANSDMAGATALLDQIRKEYPRDLEARSSRAALRIATGDPAEKTTATEEYRKLADESGDPEYRFEYGEALRVGGNIEAARAQYVLVLGQKPGHPGALQEMADLGIREGRIEEALRYADQALAEDRTSVRARLVRAAALGAEGRYSESGSILSGLVKEHPEIREAQLQLALLDTAEKRYPLAEKRFRQYYNLGKGDFQALEGMVELFRAQGQLSKAVALLRQDLDKGPQYAAVRALLAKTAAQNGDKDLAAAEYEKLARAEPNSSAIAIQLGHAYQMQGRLPQAIGEFERARSMAPRDPLVHAHLAEALDAAGRRSEAVTSYRQSLALDPRNASVMNNLAYLLTETGGSPDESVKLADAAARQDPGNQSFSDTLGWALYKHGDFRRAVHVFQALRDKTPDRVSYRIHLAEALLGAGSRDASQRELKSALLLKCTPEESGTIRGLMGASLSLKQPL